MAIRIPPAELSKLLGAVLLELEAEKRTAEEGDARFESDICDWAEEKFYIPATSKPVVIHPFQRTVFRAAFTRAEDGRMPWRTIIYSTVKKSGKSTSGGIAGRWFAETQTKYGEVNCVGNDLKQAKERAFLEIRKSLELTPGWSKLRERLPGIWNCQALSMMCLLTGSKINALAVDAKGEAGGHPSLSIFTELWGFDTQDAIRFWEEMTTDPTLKDSIRMVETYAGFEGESELLYGLYETGLKGHQMSNDEICRLAHRERPDQTYDYLLANAWKECEGRPDEPVPVYTSPASRLFMYWDSGLNARRMPWLTGEEGAEYYRSEEASQPPNAFRRHHLNEWVSAESSFVPMESWDMCFDRSIPPLIDASTGLPDTRTPLVVAVDAATTGDCFAVVAVSRHPLIYDEVAVRAAKRWDPKEEGGRIDYSDAENWLRFLCQGGCIRGHARTMQKDGCPDCASDPTAIPGHRVVQICYDPYQLEDMMQRLRRERVAWCEAFTQGQDRLIADKALYSSIIGRTIHHREDPSGGNTPLREHVQNSNAKVQKDQDSTLRIIKKMTGKKIDLTVALSMASARCLYLRMPKIGDASSTPS